MQNSNKPFLDEDTYLVLEKKSKLTRQEIAKRIGYQRTSSLYRLLSGENKPSKQKAELLASLLGCSPNILLIDPKEVDQKKRERYAKATQMKRAYCKRKPNKPETQDPPKVEDTRIEIKVDGEMLLSILNRMYEKDKENFLETLWKKGQEQ